MASTCSDKMATVLDGGGMNSGGGANLLDECEDFTVIEVVEMVDTLFITVCTAMVFLMQAGFALLEVGSVQSKNAKSILIKNLLDGGVGSLAWWVFGYGSAFGTNGGKNGFIGTSGFFISDSSSEVLANPVTYSTWVFQWAFATTAATIVSGCVAERMNPTSYLIFSGFITAFFYPVVVHWVWTDDGWLANMDPPFHDFAGCAPVHMLGGISGIVGAFMIGPRTGRFDLDGKPNPMPQHNMVLSTLGALILWFGWYGFNGGSVGSLANGGAQTLGRSMITTTLSAASGGLAVYGVETYITGVRDLPPLLNGLLAGLVSITGSADIVETWAAIIIGLVGAVIYSCGSRIVVAKLLDDPLDAFALHGLCGFWGIMAVGIFAKGPDPDPVGLFYGGVSQLGVQLLGALVIAMWSSGTSYVCFYLIDFCVGLRVPLKDEKLGMDEAHHGGSAYPDFVKKRGAPIQDIVFVTTDIETPRELWKADPALMVHCQTLHDTIMRTCITDHNGYEVSAEGDNFCIAFHNAEDAINFGFSINAQLLQTTWPAELLENPKCAIVYVSDNSAKSTAAQSPAKLSKSGSSKKKKKKKKKKRSQSMAQQSMAQNTVGSSAFNKKNSRPLFNGLRVRMAMDHGYCDYTVNNMTDKYSYTGGPVNHCRAILKAMQSGDQIVLTKSMNKALLEGDDPFQDSHKVSLGTHILKDVEEPMELIQCLPQELAERELLPLITVRKIGPDFYDAPSANVPDGMPVPPVTLVSSKIADSVMKKVRAGMAERVLHLHDIVLRKFLQENEGYECQGSNGKFVFAFPSPNKACAWAISTSLSFLKLDWSREPKQVADAMLNMKVNMGISSDLCDDVEPNCNTGKADYFGKVVDVAMKCCESSASGEVSLSERAYMMLPPKHPFGIIVGPAVKLGRGSETIQMYALTVPTSATVDPEHYKYTKWKPFTTVSEAEEREAMKKAAKDESREKKGKNKSQPNEVVPVEKKAASPLDIFSTSQLDAWKLNDTELDFDDGFFVAAGSFGEVKTAKFRGTLVAVKMLKANGGIVDTENLMRFKHELMLCRDLRHPNIMQVLGGCWDNQEKIYLVMEFCEKGSLGALLKREGAQHKMVTMKLNWVIEMAKAMCYLHGFQPAIVHRDLKGDNVLVNQGMSVKLCDFGESRQKTSEGTMTTVGSPFWIAPEVFMGERYDESCDVYSFALCMIEILFDGQMEGVFNRGMKDYEKKFGLAIAHKITSGWRPALDPRVKEKYPNYCQLIEDCWQHKPRHRPQFTRILSYLLALQKMVDIGKDREKLGGDNYGSSDSSSLSGTSATSSLRSEMTDNNSTLNASFRGNTVEGRMSLRIQPTLPSLREHSSSTDSHSHNSSLDEGTSLHSPRHHDDTSSEEGGSISGSGSSTSGSNSNEGSSNGSFRNENGSASLRAGGGKSFRGSEHGSIREHPNEDAS